jgi:hypothetical protein
VLLRQHASAPNEQLDGAELFASSKGLVCRSNLFAEPIFLSGC